MKKELKNEVLAVLTALARSNELTRHDTADLYEWAEGIGIVPDCPPLDPDIALELYNPEDRRVGLFLQELTMTRRQRLGKRRERA